MKSKREQLDRTSQKEKEVGRLDKRGEGRKKTGDRRGRETVTSSFKSSITGLHFTAPLTDNLNNNNNNNKKMNGIKTRRRKLEGVMRSEWKTPAGKCNRTANFIARKRVLQELNEVPTSSLRTLASDSSNLTYTRSDSEERLAGRWGRA